MKSKGTKQHMNGKATLAQTSAAIIAAGNQQLVETKLAAPPVATQPLVSVVQLYDESKQMTTADYERLRKEAAARRMAKQTVDTTTKAEDATAPADSDATDPKAEQLTKLASKASRGRKPAVPPPGGTYHDMALKAKFSFVQTVVPDKEDGYYMHGYQHTDGRALALLFTLDDHKPSKLMLRYKDGRSVEDAEAVRHLQMTRRERVATHKHDNRVAARLTKDAKTAHEAVEAGTDILTQIHQRAALPPPPPVESVAGVPAHVVRAVEMLGGLTLQSFDIQRLRGDKYYGKRMALLKKLFDRDRVLAKECGVNNVVEAFYSAVGASGKSAAAKAADFAVRCKAIAAKVRTAKSAVTKQERQRVQRVMRATVLERTVPGRILPDAPKLNKAQQRAQYEATVRDVYTLAASAEQYYSPNSNAEVRMRFEDIALLEDPSNGIVMLQIEHANSQGAICVYNNGVKVACGVVPTETLKNLRILALDASALGVAANQFLNPLTPSVPVTPVAARHLTAVIEHCKEITAMNAEALETKKAKFAPPAKKGAAKKAPHAKADKKPRAAKAERAPRAKSFSEDSVIKCLVKENPFRGTLAERFAHILNGKAKTVAQYTKLTDRYPDLGFYVKKEAISIK